MNNLYEFLSENKIKSFLDIGANNGDISLTVKKHLPDVKLFCIEANPNCEHDLKIKELPYLISCLSDVEKDIEFFVSKIGDGKNTGASYYKELTDFYSEGNYNSLKVKTKTLDSIFSQDEEFEFIKLDTQGSEIDIIKGGLNLVKRTKFIMAEVSVLRYNDRAPLKEEVFAFLSTIGYFPIIKTEEHKYSDGTVFQEDWIFRNER